jgi:hypothetical protein
MRPASISQRRPSFLISHDLQGVELDHGGSGDVIVPLPVGPGWRASSPTAMTGVKRTM